MDQRTRRDDPDEEGAEVDDLRQLELDRTHNDQKLKTRFEHIFRKYEHDFEGVGDEIDIASGDIVVDNGHLQHMRHEADPGKSASSRFVKTFTEKLGFEDESSSEDGEEEDEDTEDDDEDEQSESDGLSETPQDADSPAYASSHRMPNRISPRKAMNAFGHLARPAPRLAHLLVGEGTPQPAMTMAMENGNEDDSSTASASGTSTPINMLSRVPALQDSMRDMNPRAKRSAVEPEAIEALGVSIANQLAQLMAGPSSSKRKKTRAKEKKPVKQSVWDYPDLEPKPRKKRRRSPSPVAPPPLPSSPAPGSPGEESLWAPEGSVRPSKRLRREREESQATPALTRSKHVQLPSSGNGTSRKEVKRCWNCSLTSTPSWKTGPHGQDLCESCARYYLHNRRMKPFDSPTPSAGDEEDQEDQERAQDTGQSAKRSRPQSARAGKAAAPTLASTRAELVDDSGDDEVDEEVRSEHAVDQSRPYFYRSLPAQVPETQLRMAPPPGDNSRHATIAAQEPQSHATQAEKQAHLDSQRVPCSSTATQLSGLHRGHRWPVQKRPEDQRDPGHGKHHVPPSNNLYEEISDGEHPSDRLGDLHREDTVNDDTTHHHPQTIHRAFTPEAQTPTSSAQHESGYLANTSRTLITSPGQRANFKLHEDMLIIRLKEQEKLTWDEISLYFPHRSEYAISGRYYRELRSDRSPARKRLRTRTTVIHNEEENDRDPNSVLREDLAWNKTQDELLLELREDQELEWEEIASLLPGHLPEAVEERYKLLAQHGLEQHAEKHNTPALKLEDLEELEERKSNPIVKFSADEDALIVRLREVEGLQWSELSKRIRHRPLHSIQRRYSRCLAARIRSVTPTHHFDTIKGTMEDRILAVDPRLAGGAPYEPEEDHTIRTLKEAQDLSWDAIAQRLPGRTADAVRHRYEYKFGPDAAQAEFASERAEIEARKARRSIPPDVAALPGVGIIRFAAPPTALSPSISPPQHSSRHSLPRINAASPLVTRATPRQSLFDIPTEPQPSASSFASSITASKSSKAGPGSRTPFTEDEDDAILQLREMQGLSWEAIAVQLPGRSVNSVSSRYTEHLRPTRALKNKVATDPTLSETSAEHSSHQSSQPPPAITGSVSTQRAEQPESSRGAQHVFSASTRSGQQEPSKLKTKPRRSLPSTLLSASRSQNLLLRKALDNSLRRRSDLGSTSVSSDQNGHRIREDSDSDQEAPSQQLLEEMETSLNSPSPATRTVPNVLTSVERITDRSQVGAMQPRAVEAVSEPGATVSKLPVRPSAQATKFSQARRHGASPPPDPAVGQRWQTYPNIRFQEVQTVDNSWRPKSESPQPRLELHTPSQAQRTQRPRRAAFDSASRRNSELLMAPVERPPETFDSLDVMADQPSSLEGRSINCEAPTSNEPTPTPRKGREQEDHLGPAEKQRGRPRHSQRKNSSLPALILDAFKTSQSKVLQVKDIYALVEAEHDMHGSWKSSIRATLTQDPSFERAFTDEGRGGWQLTQGEDEIAESTDDEPVPASQSSQRRVTFESNEEATRASGDNDNASASPSTIDQDGAIVVSVGPKQRRIVSNTDAGKFKHTSTSAEDDLLAPTSVSPGTLTSLAYNSASRVTPSKGILKPSKAPREASARSLEIANSDEEEELSLEASVHELDELDLPTSPPSRRGSFAPVTNSDADRDPLSSDAVEPAVMSSSSKTAPKSTTKALPSSSPLFMKPHTPASALNKKFVTPRPSLTRPSQLRKETPVRTGSPAAIFMTRSASVANSRRSSLSKRVVETPVREVDSDEDELA